MIVIKTDKVFTKDYPFLGRELFLERDGEVIDKTLLKDGTHLRNGIGVCKVIDGDGIHAEYQVNGIIDVADGGVEFHGKNLDGLVDEYDENDVYQMVDAPV